MIKKITDFCKTRWRSYDALAMEHSQQMLQWEIKELENIYGLMLMGFTIGIPSAPMHITLDLLPLLENEMEALFDKIDTANDPLGELFSLLDIG